VPPNVGAADDTDETDDTDDGPPGAAAAVSGLTLPAADAGASGATASAAGAKAGGSAIAATSRPAVAQQPQTRSSAASDGAQDPAAVSGSAATAQSAAETAAATAGPDGDAASAADTATPDLSSAINAQNSVYAAASASPVTGASAPGNSPDAATTLAAAGASATAAVASSAARVITALAASTAVDEKHVRGGADASAVTTATAGIDGSAGAAQAAAGVPAQSTDAATATMKVGASVDSSEFSQGVANQVSTMVEKNITSAKLQVNPPSLGPIEVRIAVQGDRAQVWMVSHSAVTRDALQSSTGTLREMLSGQGFGQVSVDISQRSFQERTPTAQTYEWSADADRSSNSAAAGSVGSAARVSSGALDAYA
jgi:flagellar hook-length control protein FliK